MSGLFKTAVAAEFRQFKRCAFYGRYSTKMQRLASLEDQLRTCRDFADKMGWQILDGHIYTDAGLSGKTRAHRDGLKALEVAGEQRPTLFDYVLFDDTSRLGRDQADVLTFVKMMAHYGIKVCFVSQELDSSNENFEVLLNTFSMIDALHNKRLRSKVFSGQKVSARMTLEPSVEQLRWDPC
jgi:site-specific DNA recombinase